MPQDIVDVMPFTYQITESASGRMRVEGVFQRSDVPNANKRVYPRSLWEKELRESRVQEALNSRAMFGELDHPCLTDSDFRVLTENGWKPFADVKRGDKVWSRKNGIATLSEVDKIIDQEYSGPVFNVKGRSIDTTFTPAHKFVYTYREEKNIERYTTLQSIVDNPSKFRHSAIPKTAMWNTPSSDLFSIPGVTVPRLKAHKNDVSQDLVLDVKVFAAFMGIYLAEGYCTPERADNYKVEVCQKNAWSREYIKREILDNFPNEIEWRETPSGFSAHDARLYFYLKNLGDVYTKYIPPEVKQLSSDCLNELIFWFTIGDGRINHAHMIPEEKTNKEVLVEDIREGIVTNTRQDVFSVSERLIRDLHECVVRSGGCGSIKKVEQVGDRVIEGRTILEENRSPLWQLTISRTKNIWLDNRFLTITENHHDGRIFCLETTHGNFYMEQNGKSFWTGNSDGKTSLKRVSHIITGLHLESDGTVTGAAELLPTPNGQILKALFESGAQVGISSRGSGSVSNGVVSEDYKLSTFDFVARPSTPGALPTPGNSSRKSRYLEGKEEISGLTDISDDPSAIATSDFDALLDTIDLSELLNEEEQDSGIYERVTELCNAIASGIHEEDIPHARQDIFLLEHEILANTVDNPEEKALVSGLLTRLDEAKTYLVQDPEDIYEEVNMNRLQFIQDRLEEAAFGAEQESKTKAQALAEELSGLSDEELIGIAEEAGVIPSEEQELAEALNEMSDEELINLALDQGVLSESDLHEGEDSDEPMDLYDAIEYAQNLEAQLEEAGEVIAQLSETLEEADNSLALKYETALGIIQETVSRFQMLQEAVGGEDKADALLESYISTIESKMDGSNDASYDDVNEDYDPELLLHGAADNHASDTMSRYVQLAEEAVGKLNLN